MAVLLVSPKAFSDSCVPRLLRLADELRLGAAEDSASDSGSGCSWETAWPPTPLASEDRSAAVPGPGDWRGGELLLGGCPSGGHVRARRAMQLETGHFFVVKPMDVRPLAQREDSRAGRVLGDELQQLRSLRHPHLVQILGHQQTDHQVLLHVEYMSGGSVASLLDEFGPLSGRVLRQATRGALEGLHYLHTREPPVVHGRIRGTNILVDTGLHVKLTDFGSSKFDTDASVCASISALQWMAPEIVQKKADDLFKADVWSMGCTVIEMATADSPWGPGVGLDDVMLALRGCVTPDSSVAPPIPPALPPQGRDLAQRCLQRCPADRDLVAELLLHAFITDDTLQ